jgi:hypothetical protein
MQAVLARLHGMAGSPVPDQRVTMFAGFYSSLGRRFFTPPRDEERAFARWIRLATADASTRHQLVEAFPLPASFYSEEEVRDLTEQLALLSQQEE